MERPVNELKSAGEWRGCVVGIVRISCNPIVLGTLPRKRARKRQGKANQGSQNACRLGVSSPVRNDYTSAMKYIRSGETERENSQGPSWVHVRSSVLIRRAVVWG